MLKIGDYILSEIERLSALRYSPTKIAFYLNVNRGAFLKIWQDEASELREHYERGKMTIEVEKREALKKKIESGNLTAIQIDDNYADEQRFEDIRKQVWGDV